MDRWILGWGSAGLLGPGTLIAVRIPGLADLQGPGIESRV